MFINIHQIKEEGLDFDLERPELALEGMEGSLLLRQAKAHLHLKWEERRLHMWGEVSGIIGMTCSRCGKAFDFTAEERFDILGFPSSEKGFPENQELALEDMEATFLQGDDIDTDEIIGENLYLALPIQPLCSDSCQGLCPRCGKDLNEESCSCRQEPVDHPFGPLEALRGKMISKIP